MSRKVKLIGAVVFLLLSAGAGSLYWSGVHAQRTYEQSLSGVNSQGVFNARTASYRRGLLSSEAVTVVTFNTDSPQYQALVRSEPDTLLKNFRLVLASDIEHLPTPSFTSGRADLTITTRLDERDSKQGAWISKAGLHDVLRMTTRVGVDGNSTVTLDVKPMTYQAPETGASLDWGGLQGKFDIGAGEQHRHIRGTVRSSGFTAHAGLEQVKMDGLHYNLDGHFDVHDFFIGSQSVVIDDLYANAPADAADPNGVMSFERLTLQGEAHADDASLSVSSDILLTDLNAAGERIPRFTLRIAADKLDMGPLAGLRDLLASANTGGVRPAPIEPVLQSQIQEKLLAVLAGRPQVRITELLLETGSGTLRGNLALRLVQPPPANAVIPPLFWLSALEGEAHVTIAEPLLTLLATSNARATLIAGYEAQKQAPPPDKELDTAAAELARARLSSLETQGVLLREGNEFRTDITLANSELQINGKPFQSLAPDTSSN